MIGGPTGQPFGPSPDTLDGPPAPPPGTPTRLGSLNPGGQTSSLMPAPAEAAIMGLAMMERGASLLGSVLPGLMPQVMSMLGNLKQAVPQILGAAPGGPPTGGAPSAMGMPPGMPPGQPPGPPGVGPIPQ